MSATVNSRNLVGSVSQKKQHFGPVCIKSDGVWGGAPVGCGAKPREEILAKFCVLHVRNKQNFATSGPHQLSHCPDILAMKHCEPIIINKKGSNPY